MIITKIITINNNVLKKMYKGEREIILVLTSKTDSLYTVFSEKKESAREVNTYFSFFLVQSYV